MYLLNGIRGLRRVPHSRYARPFGLAAGVARQSGVHLKRLRGQSMVPQNHAVPLSSM